MNQLVCALMIALAVTVTFAPEISRAETQEAKPFPIDDIYLSLRDRALDANADELGLQPSRPDQPYGIIMDMGVGGAKATVVAFATGDASLYYSTGGGIIGAGQSSPAANAAAQRFVALADSYIGHMKPAEGRPLPGDYQTIFYALTQAGLITASADLSELAMGEVSLSPLFHAGQEVLTHIRLTQEK